MSQEGLVDVIGTHPTIPTSFVTDSGTAVPIANTIELLGSVVAAGTNPFRSIGSGDTVTYQVQISQALAATDATKIGLSNYNSSHFSVDANGFVSITAGGLGVLTVSGTAGRITSTGGANPVIDIDATYVGQASITTLGTITTGTWNASAVGSIYGGTGQTTYAAGDILYASAINTLSKLPAAVNGQVLTLAAGVPSWATPTTGTVTSVSGTAGRITSTGGATPVIDIDATYVGQASITTLGTVTTGTWNATVVGLAYGGTNANLTASNGGIFYSTATAGAILSGTATAGQMLRSGASTAPTWSTATFPATATSTGTILRADGTNWVATTATYPATTTANQILYSSAINTIGEINTANSGVLLTSSAGIPSIGNTLTGDFKCIYSNSGSIVRIDSKNTSNTASSDAMLNAEVGGSSGGDPHVRFGIDSIRYYCIGTDNSDSDNLKINTDTSGVTPSLGTNLWNMTISGERTMPLQPAFLAYLGSTQTNVTGNGTVYTIGTAALTEVFDQGSDFNTNGTFTAPVTGRYALTVATKMEGNTIAQTFVLSIITSNRTYQQVMGRPANSNSMSNILHVLADMDAGDTMTATITVNGEAADTSDLSSVNNCTYMCGNLVV